MRRVGALLVLDKRHHLLILNVKPPSPMSKNIDILKLNFESCTESVRVIVHPAMVLFLCQLELNLKKELVILNGNVNHNFWDEHVGLEITNNVTGNLMMLGNKHEPTLGDDMSVILYFYNQVNLIVKDQPGYYSFP